MNRQILIIGKDPLGSGGALSVAQVMYRLHLTWGFDPLYIYFPYPPVPFCLRAKPIEGQVGNMRTLALPRWASRLGDAQQIISYFIHRSLFREALAIIVVGGACDAGFPIAICRFRYLVWIGTTIRDELEAQTHSPLGSISHAPPRHRWPILTVQERITIERSVSTVVQGMATASRLREYYPNAASNLHIIGVPIDTETFRPPQRHQDNLTNATVAPYVLFTGRLNDPRKNIDMLLRAFQLVISSCPEAELVLIGARPSPELTLLASDLVISNRVRFIGKLPDKKDLVPYYQRAALFVVPSRQEGLCISALEAMACGTPVVSTRCGGPEDFVIDEETGLLVDTTPEAMADGILRLLQSPALWRRLSRSGVELVRKNYSWSVVSDRMRNVLAHAFPEVYA